MLRNFLFNFMLAFIFLFFLKWFTLVHFEGVNNTFSFFYSLVPICGLYQLVSEPLFLGALCQKPCNLLQRYQSLEAAMEARIKSLERKMDKVEWLLRGQHHVQPGERFHHEESTTGWTWRADGMGVTKGWRDHKSLLLFTESVATSDLTIRRSNTSLILWGVLCTFRRGQLGGIGRLTLLGTIGGHEAITEDKEDQLSTVMTIKPWGRQRENHHAIEETVQGWKRENAWKVVEHHGSHQIQNWAQ